MSSRWICRGFGRLAVPPLTIAFLSCVLVLQSLPAFAQVNLGRILGSITDQTGGAIVGASVTVTDVERGVSRTLTTDSTGTYSAPNLIPGRYSVRAEAQGFRTVDRKDIVVQVGQDARVDIAMQPGSVTESVTVTGELPEVNTTNAQLGGTISTQTLANLPVAGRNFIYALNYRPGVLSKPGAGGGLVMYSNGLRPDYNVFVFDGLADVNSYGNAGPLNIGFQAGGPDESVILPQDAVQEINMVENPKAEYGWRPAAQVNIGLKSGTNTLHGTAFAVGRNQDLVARNPFFATKPDSSFEQFGATVGGPIKRDKVFYYVGYEGQRYDVGNPKTFTLPTTAAGLGPSNSLPDAIAALKAAGVTPSPLSLALAGCNNAGTCVANAGLFSNNLPTTQFPTNFSVVGGSNNGSAKLDWHVNDKHNLNLDFFRGLGTVVAPVANVTQPYWSSDILGSVTVGRVVWSWIPSSSLVNEVRSGWDYSLQTAGNAADCAKQADYAALGVNTGLPTCGLPLINISGFGTPAQPTLGANVGIRARSLNYALADNLSYTRGTHLFKFGFNWARQLYGADTLYAQARGVVSFAPGAGALGSIASPTPLEYFLAGKPASESLYIGSPHRSGNYNQYAAYVQDDWRVRPRLTLNLGLRYEYQTPILEDNDQIGNFDPNSPTGLVQGKGRNLYRGYPWDFGPRFGLAWDIRGNGKTVLRSGFAISYFQPTASEFASTNSGANLLLVPTGFTIITANNSVLTTPGGVNNTGVVSNNSPPIWQAGQPLFSSLASLTTPTCTPARPCKIQGMDPHVVTPMFFLWNLGVQHAFTESLTWDISYVGNKGQHMFGSVDINQPSPVGVVPAGKTLAQMEQANRPFNAKFPWFSQILYMSNYAVSHYEGLQTTLTQRLNHGLDFTVGYTWSHSFDMSPSDIQITLPQNSLNRNAEYGPSPLDVHQRLTIQGTYQLPGRNSPLQLLKGWQLTNAIQIFSALPFNAIDTTGDVSGTGEGQDRWNLFGSASDFDSYGTQTPIPFFKGSAIPQACIDAAKSLPNGPGGSTALAQLNSRGCYMSGKSVIVPGAQGTFGNMSRNSLRGRGFRVWDITLAKNIAVSERFTAQFRTEIFNVLNSVQYAVPGNGNSNLSAPGSFGASQATPNIAGNSPIIGNGDARRFQLGLRMQF